MAEPLLQRAQRDAGRGHARAEGVAQVVEAHLADAGLAQRALEAAHEVGMVEHRAEWRVREHELIVASECGPAEMVIERTARRSASGTARLPRRVFGGPQLPRT
jgi:hypothetical protein